MQIINRLRRGIAMAVFGMVAMAGTAVAQPAYDAMDGDWWTQLETQLTESASSEVAQVRQEAFRHIIFFSENYADRVDFHEAAYEIMGLFESSDDVAERMLALAALGAIGEEITLDRLARVAEAERSDRVRDMAQAVLRARSAGL